MSFLKRHELVCLMLVLAASVAMAADPTGKWSWNSKPDAKDDPKDHNNTAELKYENGQLTGMVSLAGKTPLGLNLAPIAIKDGKVEGDTVTFKVPLDAKGSAGNVEYSGKIAGDKIIGKTLLTSGDKKSDELDWKATRVK